MTTLRTYPTRFAGFARTLAPAAALATLLAAACSGGGDATAPGGNTNTVDQTVANVSITGNVTNLNVGASATLGALAKNAAGASLTTTFAWSSSNPAIATVGASTGTVTGVAAGTAAITAAAGGKTGVRTISVSTPVVPGPAPQAVQVDMPGNSFQPADFAVAIGGTVTWVFTQVAHNVIFGGGAGTPANIPVTTNASLQRTFTTAGTFTQLCTLHAGMTGTITVR